MPGLGTSFGRGGATTAQQDLINADAILILGSSMAEAHPVGFRWVVKARERGAFVIHVDPRFSRTSALCDAWAPLRAGSDIVFVGALINYVLQANRTFHDYVVAYTNAPVLVREDGTPKHAARDFARYTPDLGICQWFHFDDHRLDGAVDWLKRLGVRHLRTGLSWADSFRPAADVWFDRLMRALEPFEVTATFCFTPEERGLAPHHTSPPLVDEEFAEFCARLLRRYWRAGAGYAPLAAPSAIAAG